MSARSARTARTPPLFQRLRREGPRGLPCDAGRDAVGTGAAVPPKGCGGHQMRPRGGDGARGGGAGGNGLGADRPQPVGANLLTESPRVGVATAAFPSP